MKKLIAAACAAALFVCAGCSAETGEQYSSLYMTESTVPETEQAYVPLNYTEQVGIWLPYVGFPEYMQSRSEVQFRSEIQHILEDAAADGINTVYFHVHPNGDAYYRSDIYPRGIYLDGEYDPLAIIINEAHKRGISVHAWLNPLRMQTDEEMRALPGDFIVKKWIASGSPCVKNVNGRWYLAPYCRETVELLKSTVSEIVGQYEVDGIHIDDYFYPTTDEEFDREAFEDSGSSDLAQWRMDNVSNFVKAMYDTVKAADRRLLFGISPQGNINADYGTQYADVRLWGGQQGYCDYIVPQIYFGFENETSPFLPTLAQWEKLTESSGVSLIIGLAAYKLGREDKWAGSSAELEWINDTDIIKKQIEAVKKSSADGYAIYK